ncbi:MAG: 4-hydroxy-tetrahydrodipicolinate reductase [Cyclobacteriaceae bacterium]|nr:4-hydroxy-tetrahydrodipicolinate reductase [Cyclobacteriaceae bacterium]
MKIVLIGYGKMGKTIERLALNRNHTITAKIDLENKQILNDLSADTVDVAIEFSRPEAAFENIKTCLNKGIPVVSGTTGWLDKKKEVTDLCENHGGTFFYASNYSVGVNIFFKLNQWLGKIMNNYPEYKIEMEEIHHTEKLDSPSGTAITLAEGILKNNEYYKGWTEEKGEKDKIYIGNKRIGTTPGTHTVMYDSAIDSIEIKHTAHSREGFALGALLVAEWIQDKKGILSMDDFMADSFL